MFALAAFKKHVAAALSDQTKVGTLKFLPRQNVEVSRPRRSSTTRLDPGDPRTPPEGTIMDLRVCDVYATALTESKTLQAPSFSMYWREPERGRALAQMTAWVRAR